MSDSKKKGVVYQIQMIQQLPPELWEHVLARGGPLALAAHVGSAGAPARVAAARIQRAWRGRGLRAGAAVWVRVPGLPLRRGVVCTWGDGKLCVRLLHKKAAFLFLPHPSARLRLAPRH